MVNNTSYVLVDANNITVTTTLSHCDNLTLNVTRTINDLRHLFQSTVSNLTPSVFLNVSITNFNCAVGVDNYFEQILTFTQSISVRIQVLFTSIYFDYLTLNSFHLNGFFADREVYLNFSSITTNNTITTDACTTAEIAGEPFCIRNVSYPICKMMANRWNYTCNPRPVTNTTAFSPTGFQNNTFESTPISPILTPWQLGLIIGSCVLFLLILILLVGLVYRRCTRSKQLAISRVTAYDDIKLVRKSELSQNPAFQRTATNLQPKFNNNAGVSRIANGNDSKLNHSDETLIDIQPPDPYRQIGFIGHAKVQDPGFPTNFVQKPVKRVTTPTSPPSRPGSRLTSATVVSRPISGTSTSQLKTITDGLQEDKLDASETISIDRSNTSSPKKPSTPISRQLTNLSFFDESLHDEDAWMSILDVVNAELAVLNEQDRLKSAS